MEGRRKRTQPCQESTSRRSVKIPQDIPRRYNVCDRRTADARPAAEQAVLPGTGYSFRVPIHQRKRLPVNTDLHTAARYLNDGVGAHRLPSDRQHARAVSGADARVLRCYPGSYAVRVVRWVQ